MMKMNPAALVILLLLPAAAAAQTSIDALAPGDTIRVRHVVETLRSRGGAVVDASTLRVREGELVSLDADSLVLHGEYALVRLPRSAIRELEVQRGTRPGSATRGALQGGLIGAAVGATLLFFLASSDDGGGDNAGYGSDSAWIGAGAGAGLLLGAGIGAIINRLRSVPDWHEVEVGP